MNEATVTDCRATPEQWADVEHRANQHGNAHACILELRARIELLEATQHAHIEANSKPTPNPSQIRSSLVERVAVSLRWSELPEVDACAAIREVAAWLREHYGGPTASTTVLEQEAER